MARTPKLYPPDGALVKHGLVKQLYQRIRDRKDCIQERVGKNHKAIFGHRPLIELNGDVSDIEDQAIHIEDTAHAIYESKDTTVYLVRPELDKVVAEAISNKDGKSIWNGEHATLNGMIEEIYRLFPKNKATQVKATENPDEMNVRQLEQMLARKKLAQRKQELSKYGEREDFSDLPLMTTEQREAEMLDGRPTVDEVHASKDTAMVN